MSAIFTSLAQLGSQVGTASNEAREEKQARAAQTQKMDVEQAYLQLAKQTEDRQQAEFEQRKKTGDILELDPGKVWWSVSQGKAVNPPRPSPMDSLRKFVSTLPPAVAKGAQTRAEAYLEDNPLDHKGAITEVMRYADAQQAEGNRRTDAATTEANRRADAKTAEANRREDRNEARLANEAFQKAMVDFRLQERYKYMTPQERQTFDAIKTAEPMVNRLTKFIEDNNLQNENSLAFGNHSALMQHLRFYGYKKGVEPEKVSSQLIKDAAALQVMGARPWMTMGRGKYMFETISQHLPSPTDTPQQLYSKTTWLRDNVLSDAKQALESYVQPGGGGGGAPQQSAPDHNSDPLGVLQ
jgi:hypothetical protein